MAGSNIARDGDGMPGRVKNHGTLTNMDPATDWLWSDYLGRWVQDFDRVNDHILVPRPGILTSGTVYTYSVWLNWTGGAAYGLSWSIGDGASHVGAADINNIAGRYVFKGQSASNVPYWTWTTGWHHLAHVWDGTNAVMYVDGHAPTASSGGAYGGGLVTYDEFRIGGKVNFTGYFFGGQQCDQLLHSRVLSPTEISELADPTNVMLSGLLLPPMAARDSGLASVVASVGSNNPLRRRGVPGMTHKHHIGTGW